MGSLIYNHKVIPEPPNSQVIADEISLQSTEFSYETKLESQNLINEPLTISIIICALNEAATIRNIVLNVYHTMSKVLDPNLFEIVVINDGSHDDTAAVAASTNVAKIYSNKRNMGKGYSMRKGALLAQGKYLFFIDADGSHEIHDLLYGLKLILCIEKNNKSYIPFLITGVRFTTPFTGTSTINTLGNKMYTLLTFLLWRTRLNDLTCGLRFISRDNFLNLNLSSSRYTIETEMIAKALRKNYTIIQFPIYAKKRQFGKSGIRVFKEGIIIPMTLVLASLNLFSILSKNVSI